MFKKKILLYLIELMLLLILVFSVVSSFICELLLLTKLFIISHILFFCENCFSAGQRQKLLTHLEPPIHTSNGSIYKYLFF